MNPARGGNPPAVVSAPEAPADGAPQRAALSRGLSDFLIELSIAVHRYAMYPIGHPSLGPATDTVAQSLGRLLDARPQLSIGVAQKQLVIEGVATDPRHPVLSDLARRLHGHQLGAVTFLPGVDAWELEGMLGTLSADTDRQAAPIGTLPVDEIPSWEHVRLYPVGYDRLAIGQAGGDARTPARATQLWLGLAQAAMATDEELRPEDAPDAGTIARTIAKHRREGAYDQVIVGYLLQLAEELKSSEGGDAEVVRRRLSSLINELDPDTLRRMVEMGGDVTQRRRFVLDSSKSLAVDSVVRILQAAAEATEQSISSSLTRMLSKLAAHAERGAVTLRSQADSALRDNVEELVRNWELADPNPEDYTLVLDQIARSGRLFPGTVQDGEMPGPARVLQTSLEVDAYGPTVQKAFSELLDQGEMALVIELLEEAPPGCHTAELLKEQVDSPLQLRKLLSRDDVDDRALTRLVERLGTRAVSPLVDALTESESRAIRRKVFDRLVALGPMVAEEAERLIADDRWFVLRNGLALFQQLGSMPQGISADRYLAHPDPRVRREALPLALRESHLRGRALAAALSDEDERLVRMALAEVREELPETLVPTLVSRVIESDRVPELKSTAVRALGNASSTLALDALVRLCSAGRGLFGGTRIAKGSQEVLAALSVLSGRWSHDPRAREILGRARKSKDPAVREAAAGRATG